MTVQVPSLPMLRNAFGIHGLGRALREGAAAAAFGEPEGDDERAGRLQERAAGNARRFHGAPHAFFSDAEAALIASRTRW